MTRRKVKLAFISNEASRKATFKKRKKGFLKKVRELATLCGIEACAVLYSPYDSGPVVWPSEAGVQSVVADFRALPTMDQERKMVDQEAFLRQRIAKATDYLRKSRKENRELEMTEVMFQCFPGNIERFHMNILDLNDLGFLTDQYLKEVNRRIELYHNAGMEIGESSNAGMEIGGSSNAAAFGPGGGVPMPTMAATSPYDATGFFNHIEQQGQQQGQHFHHFTTPHAGFHEHSRNQQPWSMEMMNHPEQMRYRPEQEFPIMDDNRNQHNTYHQLQRQQFPGESSSGPVIASSSGNTSSVNPAIASSSGNTPTTDPSLPNNLWFR